MLAEVTLTLGDWTIVAGMISAPMTWVAWSISAMRREQVAGRQRLEQELHAAVQRLDQRASAVDTKLWELEHGKAEKTDWVRNSLAMQRKQDETMGLLRELQGKLDATVGITASLGRIAQTLERQADGE